MILFEVVAAIWARRRVRRRAHARGGYLTGSKSYGLPVAAAGLSRALERDRRAELELRHAIELNSRIPIAARSWVDVLGPDRVHAIASEYAYELSVTEHVPGGFTVGPA